MQIKHNCSGMANSTALNNRQMVMFQILSTFGAHSWPKYYHIDEVNTSHFKIATTLTVICQSRHLQSRDMPTERHLRNRQYWQRLRLSRITRHFPSRKQR